MQKSVAQKLQLQWGSKKQRKKVSKKRSKEEHDKLDSLQHRSEQGNVEKKMKFNERCHHAAKLDTHQLDKSDICEELNPPTFVLEKGCSSKINENNNERKRRPGMVIRIKLPMKKHKDTEPVSASTDPCCSSPAKKPKLEAILIENTPHHSSRVTNTSHCSSQVTKRAEVQAVLPKSAPRRHQVVEASKIQAILPKPAPRRCPQVTKTSEVQAVLPKSAPRRPQVTEASKIQAILPKSAPRRCPQVIKPSKIQEALNESNSSKSFEVNNKLSKAQASRRSSPVSARVQAGLTESPPSHSFQVKLAVQASLTKSVLQCSSQVTKMHEVQAELTKSAPRRCPQVIKPSKIQEALNESNPRKSFEVSKLTKTQASRCSPQAPKLSNGKSILNESAPSFSPQVTKSSNARAVLIESASNCRSQVTKTSNSKSVITKSAMRKKEVPSTKQRLEKIAEPLFSGPAPVIPVLQKGFVEANTSKSRQKKRSSDESFEQRRERRLFTDLIINWKPPSIQPIEADEGELDMLLAAPRKSQICNSAISGPGTCPSSASSLQPRATYIPQFNMFQLPYTIPF